MTNLGTAPTSTSSLPRRLPAVNSGPKTAAKTTSKMARTRRRSVQTQWQHWSDRLVPPWALSPPAPDQKVAIGHLQLARNSSLRLLQSTRMRLTSMTTWMLTSLFFLGSLCSIYLYTIPFIF